MRSRRNRLSGYALSVVIASAFLLGACGQTGDLYMPETYSTKPPPPPRESRINKKTQQTTPETSESDTEKTDKRN